MAEAPASAVVIASRFTMGFGTLCWFDTVVPFAEIDGRLNDFVTETTLSAGLRRNEMVLIASGNSPDLTWGEVSRELFTSSA
jgi:hypothetical protein